MDKGGANTKKRGSDTATPKAMVAFPVREALGWVERLDASTRTSSVSKTMMGGNYDGVYGPACASGAATADSSAQIARERARHASWRRAFAILDKDPIIQRHFAMWRAGTLGTRRPVVAATTSALSCDLSAGRAQKRRVPSDDWSSRRRPDWKRQRREVLRRTSHPPVRGYAAYQRQQREGGVATGRNARIPPAEAGLERARAAAVAATTSSGAVIGGATVHAGAIASALTKGVCLFFSIILQRWV